jgi:hypothetical protein
MSKYIFYDFETTSLDVFNLEIVDIAAANCDFNYELQSFFQIFLRPTVQPDGKIGAEHIHGLTKEFFENRTDIYGQKEGFCKFIDWINEMGSDIILVGYNNLGYDALIIENLMKKYDLKFNHQIYHLDLYVLIKQINTKFNLRRNKKIADLKLTTIYKIISNKSVENAHSAEGDIRALIYLMKNIKEFNTIFDIDITNILDEWHLTQYMCVCDYLHNFILSELSYKVRFNKYLKSYNIATIEDVYKFCNENEHTYKYFIISFLLSQMVFDNQEEKKYFTEKINTFLQFYFNNVLK